MNQESQATTRTLVAKLWSYCNVLRDAGLSTIEYVEQLSYLLFLKMAHEYAQHGLGRAESVPEVPEGYDWKSLVRLDGPELGLHYQAILEKFGTPDLSRRTEPGAPQTTTFERIFEKAENRIGSNALLRKLIVDLIGSQNWASQTADVKGDAYEGLLAKGAEDIKTGAGQYFTPRPLIEAIVECMQPTPDDRILDPACGTGGFLLAAVAHLRHRYKELTDDQRRDFDRTTFRGVELVPGTARLAAMNLFLHGVGAADDETLITLGDALAVEPTDAQRATMILANPPFGKKSAITFSTEEGTGRGKREDVTYARRDFWAKTTNKQLNFLQHIASSLLPDGRAAVIVPDNVLFEGGEGGAGTTIRRRLLREYDVHTLLRLPTGIFYAGGVKANVLFFDRRTPRADGRPWTSNLWVYDLRTGQNLSLKQNPLRREHLQDFIECYLPGKDRTERVATDLFKPYSYEKLLERNNANLDITWHHEPAAGHEHSAPTPSVIARQIANDLRHVLESFESLADDLADAEHKAEQSRPALTSRSVREQST